MFGACGAGLRKDCIRPVCLARHIDDPLPNTQTKKGPNESGPKKTYRTRSTEKKCTENPKKMTNRGLKAVGEEEPISFIANQSSINLNEGDYDENEVAEISHLLDKLDNSEETIKEKTRYRLNSLCPKYGPKNYYKTGLKTLETLVI